MEIDSHLTFRDIHGSYAALMASLEDIKNHAGMPGSKASTNAEKFLRFIKTTPVGHSPEGSLVLPVAASSENWSETNYVAVSYCWNSHGEGHGRYSGPSYLLQSPNGQRNPPKCPLQVLHRARKYALAYKVPFIWIDQECIDQNDPQDVQKHLQAMHKIYSQAKHSIGLLTRRIQSSVQLESLLMLLQALPMADSEDYTGFVSNFENPTLLAENALQLLRDVQKDEWFSRTWTFQEKYCSVPTGFRLLIPTPSRHYSKPSQSSYLPLGVFGNIQDEVELPVGDVCDAIYLLSRQLSSKGPSIRSSAPRELEGEIEPLSGYRWNDHHGPQGHTLPRASWVRHGYAVSVANVFKHIAKCTNRIVSDRLAILGNLCELPYRLNTHILESSNYSYSTCVLALILLNNLLPLLYVEPKEAFDLRRAPKRVIIPLDINIGQLLDGIMSINAAGAQPRVNDAILLYARHCAALDTVAMVPSAIGYVNDCIWKQDFVKSFFKSPFPSVDDPVWQLLPIVSRKGKSHALQDRSFDHGSFASSLQPQATGSTMSGYSNHATWGEGTRLGYIPNNPVVDASGTINVGTWAMQTFGDEQLPSTFTISQSSHDRNLLPIQPSSTVFSGDVRLARGNASPEELQIASPPGEIQSTCYMEMSRKWGSDANVPMEQLAERPVQRVVKTGARWSERAIGWLGMTVAAPALPFVFYRRRKARRSENSSAPLTEYSSVRKDSWGNNIAELAENRHFVELPGYSAPIELDANQVSEIMGMEIPQRGPDTESLLPTPTSAYSPTGRETSPAGSAFPDCEASDFPAYPGPTKVHRPASPTVSNQPRITVSDRSTEFQHPASLTVASNPIASISLSSLPQTTPVQIHQEKAESMEPPEDPRPISSTEREHHSAERTANTPAEMREQVTSSAPARRMPVVSNECENREIPPLKPVAEPRRHPIHRQRSPDRRPSRVSTPNLIIQAPRKLPSESKDHRQALQDRNLKEKKENDPPRPNGLHASLPADELKLVDKEITDFPKKYPHHSLLDGSGPTEASEKYVTTYLDGRTLTLSSRNPYRSRLPASSQVSLEAKLPENNDASMRFRVDQEPFPLTALDQKHPINALQESMPFAPWVPNASIPLNKEGDGRHLLNDLPRIFTSMLTASHPEEVKESVSLPALKSGAASGVQPVKSILRRRPRPTKRARTTLENHAGSKESNTYTKTVQIQDRIKECPEFIPRQTVHIMDPPQRPNNLVLFFTMVSREAYSRLAGVGKVLYDSYGPEQPVPDGFVRIRWTCVSIASPLKRQI